MHARPRALKLWINLLGWSAALFATSALGLASVYRWTDHSGRVNYAANAPLDPKLQVRVVQVGPADPSSTQAASSWIERPPTPGLLSSNVLVTRVTSAAIPLLPEHRLGPCQRAWKRFEESYACFERYRLVNGAVRELGFARCEEVRLPNCPRGSH